MTFEEILLAIHNIRLDTEDVVTAEQLVNLILELEKNGIIE